MTRPSFASARRIVVKAGTRTLLDDAQKPDLALIGRLLGEMVRLKEAGKGVIFVSSGAIGTGLAPLGLSKRPSSIPELQAAAAVGQSLLMQVYNGVLAPLGYAAAQLLLTHEDFRDRGRYLNVRNVLAELDARKVLPVINENDTVATEEIKFGDNDLLAGLVSNAADAEVTVLLSDVEGFLMDGALQPEVREVTPQVEAAAGGTTGLGSGGMISKIRCAKTVTSAGGVLLLAHGKRYGLADILEGRTPGTLFAAKGDRLDHHKRWLAHSVKTAGAVTVDAGGAAALKGKGKSLLPVGVTACEGDFEAGDAVDVKDPDGKVVARGLANYSSSELRRILGKRTEEIEKVLGYRSADEAIHRDNLVLLG